MPPAEVTWELPGVTHREASHCLAWLRELLSEKGRQGAGFTEKASGMAGSRGRWCLELSLQS